MSAYDPTNPSSGAPDSGAPSSNSNGPTRTIKLTMSMPPLMGEVPSQKTARNRVVLQHDLGTILRSIQNNKISGKFQGVRVEADSGRCGCNSKSAGANPPLDGGRILYDDPPPLDPITINGPMEPSGPVVIVVDPNGNILAELTLPLGQNLKEYEDWLKRIFTPGTGQDPASPQTATGGASGDSLADYQKRINDQLAHGWNDAPPVGGYIDPYAFQEFQDTHKKETPIDKGRGANAGNSTYNDDGCKLGWGIGLGAHENAYYNNKLPLESDEKLWNNILDPSEPTNLIDGRPWKATDPGMGQFLDARDKFMAAGAALRELQKILQSPNGWQDLQKEIQDEINTLSTYGFDLKFLGLVKGGPILSLVRTVVKGYFGINKYFLEKYLSIISNMDTESLLDMFKKMYEISYRQMVEAYANLIKNNRRDSKTGQYIHKLCDTDQQMLNNDIIPALNQEMNAVNDMFGPDLHMFQLYEEFIPNPYRLHSILPGR